VIGTSLTVDQRDGGFDLGEAAQRAVEIGLAGGGAAGFDETLAERLERCHMLGFGTGHRHLRFQG
jgi:hypothetical protein